MRTKCVKTITRKTKIRVNQICCVCNIEITKGSNVWLTSNLRGKNRKYYHIECGDKTDEF